MARATNSQFIELLRRWECRDSSYLEAEPPLVFTRAKGSRVWDAEGRMFIDLCAGFGVLALGHNSDIQAKVFQQSCGEEGLVVHAMGDVYPSAAKAELLARLGELLPDHLERGALALSGGQAVELAVKTAQLATGKTGFITFEGSYHGLDLGILPLTSRADFKDPFLSWIPTSYISELPFGADMEIIRQAIETQTSTGHGCAAVIVEPIQGRAGVRLPPISWLRDLSELCRRKNVLLIFDEVFTGIGRTGRMTYADEAPCDLLCLGKALGGGLPLSACFGRASVMQAWPQNKGEAIHTGTFFGHPLSCRLGLATLEAIVGQGLLDQASMMGESIREDLRLAIGSNPMVREIRGAGMMTGIELREAGLGARWMDALRASGVIALANGMYGQGLAVTPALNIPQEDWKIALEKIVQTLQYLNSGKEY